MSEQNEIPVSVPAEQVKKKGKRSPFFWPIILIVVGVVLFIQNLNIGVNLNWWAVFVFIPVAASLNTAFSEFRKQFQFNSIVAGSLGGALMVGVIATMLLLGMDWSRWWPLVIMAAGGSTFINGIPSLLSSDDKALTAFVSWSFWIGIGAILLGAGFLAIYLPIPALKAALEGYRWWAIPILIAGLGALVSALVLSIRAKGEKAWARWGLVLAGIVTLIVGAMAFYGISWSILLPVILIAAGVIIMTGVLNRK